MNTPPAPDFSALLAGLARELRGRGLPFMLIGGQAVLLHGQPRLTDDIDLTLGVDPSRLPDILAACEALGLHPLPGDTRGFVNETGVLPAQDRASGVRIDFIFSSTPYELQAIDRAVRVNLLDVPVPFASAEDLLLHKLFAARPRDIEDAAGVVRRRGTELDWGYLERWAAEFATVPGREDLPRRLEALRDEARDP